MSTVEQRLKELGIILPDPPESIGSYVPVVQTGNLCYVSGQIPRRQDGTFISGTVGGTRNVTEAREAAQICAVNMLAQLKKHLGSLDPLDPLDRIKRIVQIQGFVRSDDDFQRQPDVIDGASDLLIRVFGEIGKHTRTAVGVKQLPDGAIVELCGIVEVD